MSLDEAIRREQELWNFLKEQYPDMTFEDFLEAKMLAAHDAGFYRKEKQAQG